MIASPSICFGRIGFGRIGFGRIGAHDADGRHPSVVRVGRRILTISENQREQPPLTYRGARPYVPVAAVSDIPPGTMRTVDVDDWRIVVVNVDGEFRAFDNRCPHLGGPLGKGRLEGGALVCPWHGWTFDARTGRAIWPADVWRATRFQVVVEDGQVKVQVA